MVVADERVVGSTRRLGIDHRITGTGDDARVEAVLLEDRGHELGTRLHPDVLARDAWLGDEPRQACQCVVYVLFDEAVDGLRIYGPTHHLLLSVHPTFLPPVVRYPYRLAGESTWSWENVWQS